MARIRTIKPDIWTDPDFVECSTNARLLLVASLNFASDYGVLPDKPTQLKMQCFPGDSIDVAPLVDELVAARFYVRRPAPDGSRVLVIRTFTQHQRVDRPQAGRWGNPADWPPFDESSSTIPRTFDESSTTEGNGKEGNGKGMDLDILVNPQSGSTVPDRSDAHQPEFEDWWQVFPRKVSKSQALKAYKARRREGISADDLGRAVASYAIERDGEPAEFTMHGATFLAKGGPWSERLDGPMTTAAGVTTRGAAKPSQHERNVSALDAWAASFDDNTDTDGEWTARLRAIEGGRA